MTAIVAGQGLGLVNTSVGLLGGQGQLGVAAQGRSGEKVVVNAANGNLVIQQQDEWLVGIGPDVSVVRTYNSQATLGDDDNSDNWRLGLSRRVFGLVGTVNTTTSTIQRMDDDGHISVYLYDRIAKNYVCTSSGGSFDTLSYNTGNQKWTWTDGDSRTSEVYGVVNSSPTLDSRLESVADVDGNKLVLSYFSATSYLITKVDTSTASGLTGESVAIAYDTAAGKTNNILSLTTTYKDSLGATQSIKRVAYTYDTNNRLSQVRVDLTPANTADAKTYVTAYTYDDASGISRRIKTLIESDGSLDGSNNLIANSTLTFGYDTSATPRVTSVQETIGVEVRTTTFDYSVAGQTKVTDPLLQVTTLQFDTSVYSGTNALAGQLLSVTAPAVGGVSQVTAFAYDGAGNVTSITDPRGNVITYRYDSHGNRVFERDAQGNVIERSFNNDNKVLSETVYTGRDTDGAGALLATGGLTTRYYYDTKGHLRFTLSPEGRVTENQYNAAGQRTSTFTYSDATYTPGALASWQQDFSANAAGFTPTTLPTGFAVSGGQLSVSNTYVSTGTTYPYIVSGGQAMGANWRLEFTTPANAATGNVTLGITDGISKHAINIINGEMVARANMGANAPTIPFGNTKAATTYVLEINTQPDGSSQLYVYEKGKERSSGYSDLRKYTGWGTPTLSIETEAGKDYTTASSVGTYLVDNVSVQQQSGESQLATWAAAQKTAAAAASQWTQDFTSGTSGLRSPTGDATLPTGFALQANGTFTVTNTIAPTTTAIMFGAPGPLGASLKTEITTPANVLTGNMTIGFESGQWGNADYVRHAINISNGVVVLKAWQGTNAAQRQLTPAGTTIKPSTPYVLEVVTMPDGTSQLYFYEKGQARNSLYVDTQAFTKWKTPQLFIDTIVNPSVLASTVGSFVLDNISITSPYKGIQRSDYTYNLRGQLDRQISYDSVSGSSATGVSDATQSITQFVYDQTGNLLKQIDGRNNVTSYSYDGLNRITSQTDGVGNPTATALSTTAYDDLNLKTVVTLANGLSTTSTYDQGGHLLSVAKANGAQALGTSSYTYDKLGRLVASTSATGEKSYILYDEAGRQVGEIDAENELTEYSYNKVNQVVLTKRYANKVDAAKLVGDGSGLLLANVRPTLNPTDDRVSRVIYDKAGRTIKTIDAMGAVVEYRYDGAGRQSDTLAYLTVLTPAQLTTIGSATGELAADNGTITAGGTLITLTTNANDRRTRSFYSNDGQLIGQLDADGYYSANSYDAAGRLAKTTRYANVMVGTLAEGNTPPAVVGTASGSNYVLTSAANDQVSYFLYNARNQLVGTLDAESYYTTFQYDAAGNKSGQVRYKNRVVNAYDGKTPPAVIARSGPTPTSPTAYLRSDILDDQYISYTYDADNRLLTSTELPVGLTTSYTYDSVGNVTKTVRAVGITTDERTTQRRYDKLGRVTAELGGAGSKALADLLVANPSATTTQIELIWSQYATQYLYDNASRRTAMIEPNGSNAAGNKTVYYYDKAGRLTHSINALGEVSQYTFNAFGEQTAATKVGTRVATAGLTGGLSSTLGTLVSSVLNAAKDSTAKQTFDVRGQVNNITDALNNTSRRGYNAFGELSGSIQRIDATTTAQTLYTYDRRGNLRFGTEVNLGNRVYANQSYDAFGRVTSRIDGNGNTTNFGYDRLGRQVLVADPTGATHGSSYDAFDRTLSTTDGLGNITTYTYDSANRKVTLTTPELIQTVTESNRYGQTIKVTNGRSAVTTYTYDADGKLQSAIDPAGTVGTTYDMAGRVYESKDGRGIITRTTYDAANRVLTRIVDAAAGGLNLSTQYIYDAKGQSVWVKDANGTWTKTEYDLKGQVTAVVVDPKQSPNWVSGPDDNPAGLAIRTEYTYDARGKTLTVIEGAGSAQPKTTQYIYDAAGRRTSEIVDPYGSLKLTTGYTYDKADNVVAKTDANGKVTRYVYDASNQLIYAVDATGAVTKTEYDQEGRVSRTTAYANRIELGATTINSVSSPAFGLNIAATDITARLTADATRDQSGINVYDKNGRLSVSIDALNYASKRSYDGAGNVIAVRRYATKVAAPAIAKQTGNLVSFAAPTLTANDGTDQVTKTAYDTANRPIWSVDALSGVTRRYFDANGNVTQTTRYYNPATAVAADSTPTVAADTQSPSRDQITYSVYDSANRVTFVIDPESYVTQNKYDSNGHLTNSARFAGKLNGTYAAGQAPKVLNVGDATTGLSSWVFKAATSDTQKDATTNIGYDKAGRQTTQSVTDGSTTLSAVRKKYDAAGRVSDSIDADGTGQDVTTHYNYDTAGRVIDEIVGYRADGSGPQQPDYADTRYVLDAVGNRVGVIDPRGIELAEGTTTWAQQQRQAILGSTAAPAKSTDPASSYQQLLGRYTTTQVFDAQGRVTQSVDALNGSTDTTYDAFGNAVRVKDPNGNYGYFAFDQLNQATWQIDPVGYATQTKYDGLGQVQEIVKYANDIKNFHNLWPASATTPTDPLTDNTSISLPYLIKDVDKDAKTVITHDLLGRQTKIQDAEGFYESMTYDALGNKQSYTAKSKSDNKSEVAPSDRGTYTYKYDRKGLLIEEKLPEQVVSLDKTTGLPVTGAAKVDVINKYEYDARGNRTKSTEAFGLYEQRITNYKYDALDRQTEKSGEAMGIYTVTGGDQPAKIPTECKIYDARGNLIESKAADGGRTLSYYDALNRKIAEISPTGTLIKYTFDNASNLIAMYIYGDAIGLPATPGGTLPDPTDGTNCRATLFKFDSRGRQINTIIEAVTTGQINAITNNYEVVTGDLITTRDTDANGNVIYEEDARKNATYSYYDKAGHKILQVDAERYVTKWEYYGNGKVKSMTCYAKPLASDVTVAKDVTAQSLIDKIVATTDEDRTTEYDYDLMGRLKEERTLKVMVSSLDVNHLPVETTKSVSTKYDYNGLGLVTKRTDAALGVTEFSYDKQGHQVLQQDPTFTDSDGAANVRHRIKTEFNGLGLERRNIELGKNDASEDDDHITVYSYNGNGVRIAQTDAQNVTQTFKVDAMGRITSKSLTRTDADGGKSTDTTGYQYDLVGRQTKQIVSNTPQGQASRQLQTTETQYNTYGEIIAKGTNGGWQEFAQFDKAGRLFKSNTDTGAIKVYVNDARGNATLTIESSDTNLKSMTLDSILGLTSGARTIDTTAKTQLQSTSVLMTFTVYDKNNRVTDTYSPALTGTAQGASIQANSAGQSVFVGNSSAIQLQPISSTSSTTITPIVTPFDGIVSISRNSENIIYRKYEDWYVTPYGSRITIKSWITLPDYSYISQNGKITIEDTQNFPIDGYAQNYNPKPVTKTWDYTGPNFEIPETTSTDLYIYYWRQIKVYKEETSSGKRILLATIQAPRREYHDGDTPNFDTTYQIPTSTQSRIYIKHPSSSASKLVLFASTADTNRTCYFGEQLKATDGNPIPGLFSVTMPNGYKGTFTYFELNDANQILNTGYGSFNTNAGAESATQNATSIKDLNWTADTPSGAGWFFPSESSRMNMILPTAATKLKLRYKYQKNGGTATDWITIDSTDSGNAINLKAGSYNLGGPATPGWFNFAYTSLPFTVGDTYNYTFDVVATTDAGTEVNRFIMNYTRSGNGTVMPSGFVKPYSLQSSIVKLTEATSTKYVDLSYKKVGTQDAPVVVRLSPTATNSDIFNWDASALTPDPLADYNFEVTIKAYSDGDLLNNWTNATVKLGPNATVVSAAVQPLSQTLRLTPSESSTDSIQISYRKMGDTSAAFTALTATKVGSEFRVNLGSIPLPASGSVEYEYVYDAYQGSKLLNRANGSFFVQAASATTSGTASRLDWLISTSTLNNTIHKGQAYNAFGEVKSETDGRGNTTRFTYTTLGKLQTKVDPATKYMDTHGDEKPQDTPTTRYYYDTMGRQIGTKDALGNNITQSLLAGFSDGQLRIAQEFHPDNGNKSYGYDVFGNLRFVKDEEQRKTDYTYDKNNRLTKVERPTRGGSVRAYDQYDYDEAGSRIAHTTTDGVGTSPALFKDKVYYDGVGRIWKTVTAEGRETKYDYTYDAAITGIMAQAVGGWRKVTTDAVGRQMTDETDVFGHTTLHKDMSNHVFTYAFNWAGWMTSQTSLGAGGSGQNVVYEQYANGYVKSIWDKAAGTYTSYEYDANGNKTFEGYAYLRNPLNLQGGVLDFYQTAKVTYDELNRVKSITDPKATITYDYDEVGNRRHVKSVYNNGVNGAQTVQEYWYTYDSMNRFLISMGSLVNKEITRGALGGDGVEVTYNQAGERKTATYAIRESRDEYSYTAEGSLQSISVDTNLTDGVAAKLSSTRTVDLMGRTTRYDQFDVPGVSSAYNRATTYDKDNRVLTQTGTDGNIEYIYFTDSSDNAATATAQGKGGLARVKTVTSSQTTLYNYYHYAYWDDAKQTETTVAATNPKVKGDWAPGYARQEYDVNGHLVRAIDGGSNGIVGDSDDRVLRYATNAQGLILRRDEIDSGKIQKLHNYYYLDSHRVGEVGNDGDARVDYVQSLAKTNLGRGDYKNWKPIASADFDQNFEPITANYPGNSASSYTVRNGDKLPSIAQAVWGDSTLWYLIADANGLTGSENLPAGMVLAIPNKVTNIHNNSSTYRVYNAGEAIGDVSPTLPDAPPPPPPKKCGVLGQVISAVIVVVATIYGGPLGAMAANMLIQYASVSMGYQERMVWKNVAVAGATAAITMGMDGGAASSATSAALQAAATSVVTQGVLVALHLQEKFDWAAVATAGVGGAIGYGVGQAFDSAGIKAGNFGNDLARNMTSNVLVGAARSAIYNEEPNWSSIAISSFGNALGGATAGYIQRNDDAISGFIKKTGDMLPKPDVKLFNKSLGDTVVNAIAETDAWKSIERAGRAFGSALGDSIVGSIQQADSKRLTDAQIDKYLDGVLDMPNPREQSQMYLNDAMNARAQAGPIMTDAGPVDFYGPSRGSGTAGALDAVRKVVGKVKDLYSGQGAVADETALTTAAALAGETSLLSSDLPPDIASGQGGVASNIGNPLGRAIGQGGLFMHEYKFGALESISINTELAAQRRDEWGLYGNAFQGALVDLLPGSPQELTLQIGGGAVVGKASNLAIGAALQRWPQLGMSLSEAWSSWTSQASTRVSSTLLEPEANFLGQTPLRPRDGGDLGAHLVDAEIKFNKGVPAGISGGHNEVNFLQALQANGGSTVGLPTKVADGIRVYEYSMPGAKNTLTKTVYDPAVHSDATMIEAANEAGRKAAYLYSQGAKPTLSNSNTYLVKAGGIKWEVPVSNFKTPMGSIGLKSSNPYIPTAYPHKVQ